MSEQKLAKEAEAARALIEALRGNDDATLADMVEGETDFFEAIDAVLEAMADDEAIIEGAQVVIDRLACRIEAAKKRIAWRRGCIEVAMIRADVPTSIRRPTATITLKQAPQTLGDVDEAEIPSQFFKPQPPKLDKNGLIAALKDGAVIPGVELKPGSQLLQIRRV